MHGIYLKTLKNKGKPDYDKEILFKFAASNNNSFI